MLPGTKKRYPKTQAILSFPGYIKVKHIQTHTLTLCFVQPCCFSAGSLGSSRWISCFPAFWSWWYLRYNTNLPFQKSPIKMGWLNTTIFTTQACPSCLSTLSHNQDKHPTKWEAQWQSLCKQTSDTLVTNNNVFLHSENCLQSIKSQGCRVMVNRWCSWFQATANSSCIFNPLLVASCLSAPAEPISLMNCSSISLMYTHTGPGWYRGWQRWMAQDLASNKKRRRVHTSPIQPKLQLSRRR